MPLYSTISTFWCLPWSFCLSIAVGLLADRFKRDFSSFVLVLFCRVLCQLTSRLNLLNLSTLLIFIRGCSFSVVVLSFVEVIPN